MNRTKIVFVVGAVLLLPLLLLVGFFYCTSLMAQLWPSSGVQVSGGMPAPWLLFAVTSGPAALCVGYLIWTLTRSRKLFFAGLIFCLAVVFTSAKAITSREQRLASEQKAQVQEIINSESVALSKNVPLPKAVQSKFDNLEKQGTLVSIHDGYWWFRQKGQIIKWWGIIYSSDKGWMQIVN